MWPLFVEGDEIAFHFYSQPKKISECSVGSVVLHKDQSEWMVHRVVSLGEKKVLKGDFSNNVFETSEKVVWAETDKALKNSFLAGMSVRNYQSHRFWRKWRKIILWGGGLWGRWRYRKRCLKPV